VHLLSTQVAVVVELRMAERLAREVMVAAVTLGFLAVALAQVELLTQVVVVVEHQAQAHTQVMHLELVALV
jgi:hypothetical protein